MAITWKNINGPSFGGSAAMMGTAVAATKNAGNGFGNVTDNIRNIRGDNRERLTNASIGQMLQGESMENVIGGLGNRSGQLDMNALLAAQGNDLKNQGQVATNEGQALLNTNRGLQNDAAAFTNKNAPDVLASKLAHEAAGTASSDATTASTLQKAAQSATEFTQSQSEFKRTNQIRTDIDAGNDLYASGLANVRQEAALRSASTGEDIDMVQQELQEKYDIDFGNELQERFGSSPASQEVIDGTNWGQQRTKAQTMAAEAAVAKQEAADKSYDKHQASYTKDITEGKLISVGGGQYVPLSAVSPENLVDTKRIFNLNGPLAKAVENDKTLKGVVEESLKLAGTKEEAENLLRGILYDDEGNPLKTIDKEVLRAKMSAFNTAERERQGAWASEYNLKTNGNPEQQRIYHNQFGGNRLSKAYAKSADDIKNAGSGSNGGGRPVGSAIPKLTPKERQAQQIATVKKGGYDPEAEVVGIGATLNNAFKPDENSPIGQAIKAEQIRKALKQ